ncbi:potassium-transporting ATPase subunit B, partial [Frankia sp. Mgl5]|nr:potassium-transporting ATPase subunit B [Frankia sp. Mgl5]
GTITLGNRQASAFLAVGGVSEAELADAAQLSSLADETPEGRSVVVFAKEHHGLRERTPGELRHATFVHFTAQTRMSGVDLAPEPTGPSTPGTPGTPGGPGAPGAPGTSSAVGARRVRKGAASAVTRWVRENGG